MKTDPESNFDIAVYYDGDCPLCKREIAFLRWMDRKKRIRFENIATGQFDESDGQPEYEQLMAEIHGRLPDGSWIRGADVFRRLYTAIGWNWVVVLTRLPFIRQICDGLYRVFARHRLWLTRRCDSGCSMPSSKSTHPS